MNNAAAAAKSRQSCPTLCDPMDGSPPGSSVSGILQARMREWAAISFSSAWKWKAKAKSLSRVPLLATPWNAAYQAPLSMGFSRHKEYWRGVPLSSLPSSPRVPQNKINTCLTKKLIDLYNWILSTGTRLEPPQQSNVNSGSVFKSKLLCKSRVSRMKK